MKILFLIYKANCQLQLSVQFLQLNIWAFLRLYVVITNYLFIVFSKKKIRAHYVAFSSIQV